jgi:alpha-L-rhamnosidase
MNAFTFSVGSLRVEYQTNPLGIDVPRPRLSWIIQAEGRDVMQTAYQVQVAARADDLAAGRATLWDSGQVASDRSVFVAYKGPEALSRQRCYWRVRVWLADGQASDWSQPAWWEWGLLAPADWTATWITPELGQDASTSQPCPLLRRQFVVSGSVARARLYITGLGLYECHLNGQRVGDQVLTPGWTSYDHRVQYQTYDVTAQLQAEANALGIALGDGWYRGYLGFEGQRNNYGERALLLAQLEISYADGRRQVVGSDAQWRASTGPLLTAELYHGETYDARLEQDGWDRPGYDDQAWAGVSLASYDGELVAPVGPPMRRIEELEPLAIIRTPAGETVVDMGQNMVGWVRLRVEGPAGATVTLRHAEVLDADGNLYTANLRSARQTVRYTLRGEGVELYEPRFTFMGFRYVGVEGFPGELTLDALTGVVVHSDMASIGAFVCNQPLHNQLQHNILWGQKGNFLDVPTDCPQRDERLGWTGDAQVFARTAAYNLDVAGFFAKWLQDLAADQSADGSVPFVVPDIMGRSGRGAGGSSAWGDAAVICPWTMYLCYGDVGILEQQVDSMAAWVAFMRDQAGGDYLWQKGFHFGDWLAIQSPHALMPMATTPVDLIATAFYAYCAQLMAQTAQVLGRPQEAADYARLAAHVRAAFCDEFLTPRGRVGSATQTSYVLALAFDLLPENRRAEAARRLAADVRERGNHLSTGFVGAPYLCHVLSRYGYLDLAYALVNQESYPSWLYPVKKGATTIWERWDGIKPDGAFQDVAMNSFNHYSYGAIGEWLYRVAGGLEVDWRQPGYKHCLVQPQPGGGFSEVRTTLRTPYGLLESAWEVDDLGMTLEVSVPANTWASVRLPLARLEAVTESGDCLAKAEGLRACDQQGSDVLVELGSGSYTLAYVSPELAARVHASVKLGLDTPLRLLLDHEDARAVLARHLGEMLHSPQLLWAGDLSLNQLAERAPERLSSEQLAAIGRELAGL